MVKLTRAEINAKISKARSKNWACETCGAPASRKFGGTTRFCAEHKGRSNRNLSFDDLRGDAARRRYLLRENGHRCWMCGIEEWQGKPAPLQLDHIDGNSDDSSRGNLRILCANCHALTPTWGHRNAGKFHTKRMQKRISRTNVLVRIQTDS